MDYNTNEKQNDIKIGERIRQERLSWGLSQKELGDELNLSENFISDIERGTRHVSQRTAEKICNYFGISYDYLYKGVQAFPDNYSHILESNSYSVREDLIHILLNCSEDELHLCTDLVKSTLAVYRSYKNNEKKQQ